MEWYYVISYIVFSIFLMITTNKIWEHYSHRVNRKTKPIIFKEWIFLTLLFLIPILNVGLSIYLIILSRKRCLNRIKGVEKK